MFLSESLHICPNIFVNPGWWYWLYHVRETRVRSVSRCLGTTLELWLRDCSELRHSLSQVMLLYKWEPGISYSQLCRLVDENIKHQQRVQSEANTRKWKISKEGENFLELKRRQTQKALSSMKILTITHYKYVLTCYSSSGHPLYNLNISLILSRRCGMLVVKTVSVWTCSMTLLQSLLVQIHADLSLEVAHHSDVSTTNIFY